jgi:TM2 domain-containing membrane protein YozV
MRLRLQSALSVLTVLIITSMSSPAQTATAPVRDTTRLQQSDSTLQGLAQHPMWSGRRITGTVLSALIPGSGQTYLGYTTKGAAFTVGTLTCALVVGLSESNIIGRNERLDELKAQYLIATDYIGADTVWTKMVSTKSLLDQSVRRRDLFLKVGIALWVANMVDVIFFSEDKGEKPFGLLNTGRRTTFALVPDPRNGVSAVLTIQF